MKSGDGGHCRPSSPLKLQSDAGGLAFAVGFAVRRTRSPSGDPAGASGRHLAGGKVGTVSKQASSDQNLSSYLSRIGSYPLLDRETEQTLARRYRNEGDLKARDLLILSNLRLVVSIAKKFQRRGLPLMDVIEEGNVGLMNAVDRFDPERGLRFSTLATWWIERAIRRALYSSVRTVRVPAYMFEIVARAKQTALLIEEETGRPAIIEDVAARMNLKKRTANLLQHAMRARTRSLSEPIGDGEADPHAALAAVLEDKATERPDEIVLGEMERAALHRMILSIDRREARILALRFGLDDDEPRTLTEIGRIVGLSRERVRQIEHHTLQRLKEALESGRLSQ